MLRDYSLKFEHFSLNEIGFYAILVKVEQWAQIFDYWMLNSIERLQMKLNANVTERVKLIAMKVNVVFPFEKAVQIISIQAGQIVSQMFRCLEIHGVYERRPRHILFVLATIVEHNRYRVVLERVEEEIGDVVVAHIFLER